LRPDPAIGPPKPPGKPENGQKMIPDPKKVLRNAKKGTFRLFGVSPNM